MNNYIKNIRKGAYRLMLLTAIAITFISLEACEDDLDQSPFSELSDSSFWTNNQQAELGVGAIYDAMQNHYARRLFYYGEFRGDNFIESEAAQGSVLELISNSIQPTTGDIVSWTDLYRMIGRANDAIKNIPNISGFNPNFLAEAYALRAYAYFDIVRVWDGAPVYLEPITSLDDDLNRPAIDGATILNEIVIPDLLEAESLMQNPSSEFRFSLTSIWALQATVYMWQNDYSSAKEKLDLIAESSEFSLTQNREDWTALFINDLNSGRQIQEGPELIMSLKFELAAGDRSGIYNLFFAGIPSALISPDLENQWIEEYPIDSTSWVARYPDLEDLPQSFVTDFDDEGNEIDVRLFGDWRYFESREEGELIGEARVAKWNKFNYNQNDDETDIVLFRLPDMLLMLAEAELQLDDSERAYELLNRVRNARQLPDFPSDEWDSLDEEGKETEILKERRFELLGEAKRWWDLRRTGRALEVMGPINGQTESTLVFPYFLDHVLQNTALEQKPGYN